MSTLLTSEALMHDYMLNQFFHMLAGYQQTTTADYWDVVAMEENTEAIHKPDVLEQQEQGYWLGNMPV